MIIKGRRGRASNEGTAEAGHARVSRAGTDITRDSRRRSRQRFLNGEIHHWYRTVLGYSDTVVGYLLDRFGLEHGDRVCDAFCGTGTTLVECMKRKIESVGIDANPSSCFAARVKTDWQLEGDVLLANVERIGARRGVLLRRRRFLEEDTTYAYIKDSGMISRGWISPLPLRRAIAIKYAIAELRTTQRYRDALLLALISEVVGSASNVKFGPELYCGPKKSDWDVFGGFWTRVKTMAKDLNLVKGRGAKCTVLDGDARNPSACVPKRLGQFSAVICSPPYPAEHDYTRNSRLELALLEHVVDRQSLRCIKKRMIRCHTKGIYKTESDASHASGYERIERIVRRIERKSVEKTHQFAPLYGTVVREYFGGMKRHFAEIYPMLRPGAPCAYVVGDQAGYLQVYIPTAELLAEMARDVGFRIEEIVCWREGASLAGRRRMDERILILRKPE
jgi:hypothetical protein